MTAYSIDLLTNDYIQGDLLRKSPTKGRMRPPRRSRPHFLLSDMTSHCCSVEWSLPTMWGATTCLGSSRSRTHGNNLYMYSMVYIYIQNIRMYPFSTGEDLLAAYVVHFKGIKTAHLCTVPACDKMNSISFKED